MLSGLRRYPVVAAQRAPLLKFMFLAREIHRQLLGYAMPDDPPHLAVHPAPTAPPPAKCAARVPARFLALRGDHEAYPGTGLGYGAVSREDRLPAAD